MVRVTVKDYLQSYVRQKGEEWGVSDPTEVVNLLIFQHREGTPQVKASPEQKTSTERSELDELAGLLD